MFVIYGLIEWRRVGNWRKCIQDCERAKRASRFFYICVENIRFFSNLNNIHCWLITVCRYNMSMTVFVTLVIWSCSLETRNLRKMISSERKWASQNICTFASEKCFTYRPETREKAINDCDLRASPFFLCVSQTCDSSQYCVGESHSLSVQCVPYVRNTRYNGLLHDDLYRPETRENPINGCERAERASRNFCTFASETYVFFLYRPENQKLEKKLYMIASKPFFFCVCLKHAILLNIFVGESHSLSVYNVSFCS